MTRSPVSEIEPLIRTHAELTPNAPAIGAPGRASLTYRGLHDLMGVTSQALGGFGVRPGDRVAAVVANGPELAALFVATTSCASFAPLNPAYRSKEFEFYLDDLKPRVLVVDEGASSPAVEVARARGIAVVELVRPPDALAGQFSLVGQRQPNAAALTFGAADDEAMVLHTSGTTARPKIVPLTQRNLVTSAEHIASTLALSGVDRSLNVMPLFHIHGLMGSTLASLAAGSSVHCSPGFDASAFFRWLTEVQPTWYSAVPTMHQAILERGPQHAAALQKCRLRFVRSSSASLPPTVKAALETLFDAPVVEAYGMTEAAHQMASNPLPPGVRKPGSVGRAAGPEVLVVDGEGRPVNALTRGEVVVRGPNVTRGYQNNDAANESAFLASGHFRTGDEGYLDEDGYLFLTGRLKEMINRGGEKVSPRELDELLLEHPAVRQAVAFAVPHPTLGEDVAAAVVLKPDMMVTDAELRAFLAPRIASFKMPQQFVFVDEVPKGPSGKLQRIGLAATLADRLKPALAVSSDPLEQALAEIWARVLRLNVEKVGVTDNFFALGGDSLSVETIIAEAEPRLGIKADVIFSNPTIRTIVAAHRKATGQILETPVVPFQQPSAQAPATTRPVNEAVGLAPAQTAEPGLARWWWVLVLLGGALAIAGWFASR